MIVSIRKEEIRMKNFNQMTERQMSKVDGGLFGMICLAIMGAGLLGLGGGVAGAAIKEKSK